MVKQSDLFIQIDSYMGADRSSHASGCRWVWWKLSEP
jgi:hypothetical protein